MIFDNYYLVESIMLIVAFVNLMNGDERVRGKNNMNTHSVYNSKCMWERQIYAQNEMIQLSMYTNIIITI